MNFLFFFGLVLACAGLAGIAATIIFANSMRRRNPKDGDAKSGIEKLIPYNYLFLMVATLGLCMLAIAVILI